MRIRNERSPVPNRPTAELSEDVGFDLSASLGFLVSRLSKQMTATFNTGLAAHGLTAAQWGVLAALWRQDGPTQQELSAATGIDAATLTEMLKRMTARGLVRRERDPQNNRYQRVYLVPQEDDPRPEIASIAASVNAAATTNFSNAERRQLIDLLTRAIANLDKE